MTVASVPRSSPNASGNHRLGLSALVAASIFGSMLLAPTFGPNIAAVDLLLCAVIALGCSRINTAGSPVRRLLVSTAPWFWLILLGSVVALFGVGLTFWAIDTLLRDAFCFAVFFAVYSLAHGRERVVRMAIATTALCVTALAVMIVATGNIYRPAGTFSNPNYAGHFLALGAAFVFAAANRALVVRLAVMAAAAIAIVRTGSFGSVSMLLAAACYVMAIRVRYHRNQAMRVAFAVLLILFAGSSWRAFNVVEEGDVRVGVSISSSRLRNTSNVREELWVDALSLVPDHPLGVGPYGVRSRGLLYRDAEVHNDIISYLVERGAIGLVGLLGLFLALWRSAVRRGAARMLLLMLLVGGIFRETLHFRHAWLFLGVAYAYDRLTPARRGDHPPLLG